MSAGWIRTERGDLVNLDHVASIMIVEHYQDPPNESGVGSFVPHVQARFADGREISLGRCDTKDDAKVLRDHIAERLVIVRDLEQPLRADA